jgi:osmoprotectant transport system substrate-binding protein
MKTIATRARAAIAVMLALALALSIAACGGSSHDNSSVTLTIASSGFSEESEILTQIYAQALKGAGYEVKTKPEVAETSAKADLASGGISAYPATERAILLSFAGLEREAIPTSESKAHALTQSELEKEGLTALPPAPFLDYYRIGTFRKTAERLHLKNYSDLEGQSQHLTLAGAQECPELIECLPGLKKYYGLQFKSFIPVYIGNEFAVLNNGKADLAMIYTVDSRLAGKSKYVTLEDDKHALPAGGRTVLVASKQAVEEAGPDFEKTVIAAQKGLTLPVFRQLNAEVEFEGKSPTAVARRYLASIHIE